MKTLEVILKEIETIRAIVGDNAKVVLRYENVPEQDLINYAKDIGLILHEPSFELPYFFVTEWGNKVDYTLCSPKKQVKFI